MFHRENLNFLNTWKKSKKRKPLVIRGARQTGKTTLVEQFGKTFTNFVSIHLEDQKARALWDDAPTTKALLRNIEVFTEQKITPGKTLLFLDEIQSEPRAIQSLESFLKEHPKLHVLSSCSWRHPNQTKPNLFSSESKFEFLKLHPLRFHEFLTALEKNQLLSALEEARFDQTLSTPIANMAKDMFYLYCIIGGIPKAVATYATSDSLLNVIQIKKEILETFEKDIPQYSSKARAPHLRFLLHQAPRYTGDRISYTGFANSEYRSREIKEAFDLLELSMLAQRVLPTFETSPPLEVPSKVSPKLLFLDVGLVAHAMGAELPSLKSSSLHSASQGSLAEQVVGQELLAADHPSRTAPFFWHRNKPGTTSEVDYCITLSTDSAGNIAIPIEIKSGKTGRLRSLFEFVDVAPHNFAVRIYDGPLHWEMAKTRRGKSFELLSVPFYLTYRLRDLIKPWITQNAC